MVFRFEMVTLARTANSYASHTKVTVLSQNLSLLALLSGRCKDVCCFVHVCYAEIDEQGAKTKQLAFRYYETPGRQY